MQKILLLAFIASNESQVILAQKFFKSSLFACYFFASAHTNTHTHTQTHSLSHTHTHIHTHSHTYTHFIGLKIKRVFRPLPPLKHVHESRRVDFLSLGKFNKALELVKNPRVAYSSRCLFCLFQF